MTTVNPWMDYGSLPAGSVGNPDLYPTSTSALYPPTTAPAPTGPTGYEWYNQNAQLIALQQATAEAQQVYQYERMRLIDEPLAQLQKDRLALDASRQAFDLALQRNAQGLDWAKFMTEMRGPRNAFAQMKALFGGSENVAKMASGEMAVPAFQAPQGEVEVVSPETLLEDYGPMALGAPATSANADPALFSSLDNWSPNDEKVSQYYGTPVQYEPTNPMHQWILGNSSVTPGANTAALKAEAEAFQGAIGNPNDISAKNFLRMPTSAQQFTLGALESKGFDAGDVLGTIKNMLPQFRAPKTAMIRN